MEYQKKKVKLITYIDHKSDLGGNAPPKNLAFLSVGGNFEFLGGGNSPPPFPSAKYPLQKVYSARYPLDSDFLRLSEHVQ